MTQARDRSALPVLAAAALGTGVAAWVIVFVEASRCERPNLAWLTLGALVSTAAPLVVALVRRTHLWLAVLLMGVALIGLVAAFDPGGVFGCSVRTAG